ncbi:hypothetical protein GCM10020219_033780 [Nonomuraea dietziae]
MSVRVSKAAVVCVPRAANYRLHGIPFGWSRVVHLAEEATATAALSVTNGAPPLRWGAVRV